MLQLLYRVKNPSTALSAHHVYTASVGSCSNEIDMQKKACEPSTIYQLFVHIQAVESCLQDPASQDASCSAQPPTRGWKVPYQENIPYDLQQLVKFQFKWTISHFCQNQNARRSLSKQHPAVGDPLTPRLFPPNVRTAHAWRFAGTLVNATGGSPDRNLGFNFRPFS